MSHTTTKPIIFKRPLVSLWTVLAVTDLKSEDEVLAAIEGGRLLWAFNIACKEAKSRLIRVLATSVSNFVEGNPPPKMSDAEEWQQVLRAIFPTPAPSFAAKEIALAWNVSGTHILNLCDQKLLRLVKGTPRHSGPGGSPQVEYQSAVDFLRARRVY
jgi:hypothetical protein